MWLEVKELDPAPSQKLLDFAHDELKSRLSKSTLQVRVDARVAPGFDQSAAKQAIGLLVHEIRMGLTANTNTFVGIPAGGLSKGKVIIEWTDANGDATRFVTRKAKNGTYGCPLSSQPGDWTGNVTVTENGASRQELAFKVLSVVDPCLVTLRVLPTGPQIGLASVGGAEAENVTTVQKLRRCISDANNQIKNGQSCRSLPSVVVVYNNHLIGDQQDMMYACLGDLTLPIDISTKKAGQPYYGKNGVLNPTKNTSISAVTYRSRLFPDISLINPNASIPIKASWLTGEVYFVDSNEMVARV